MRIIKTKNYDEMSKAAANIIAAQITLKPDSVMGFATGSTPIGTYAELIKKNQNGDIDFSNINTVNLDEYKDLPITHDQSYYYFMNDNLFNHVNIDKNNTNLPNGNAEDPDAECARYEALIKELGGIDMQLLGLGHNGHIGFNEPADEFKKCTHCVTMGIGTIMAAKKIVIVVSGEDKADALQKCITGPITPTVPGSILQLHPDVTVVCDEAAYSKMA